MKAGLEESGYAGGDAIYTGQPERFALAAIQTTYPQTRREGIRRLRYSLHISDIV
jgi:hypothetical protein